jgi:hypothetical protein
LSGLRGIRVTCETEAVLVNSIIAKQKAVRKFSHAAQGCCSGLQLALKHPVHGYKAAALMMKEQAEASQFRPVRCAI